MKTLYLFNPENDMALAYGGPYYMPPANVKRMAVQLSMLPAWYAMPQSEVWLAEERQVQWLEEECPLYLSVKGVTSLGPDYTEVMPWGWSASLVHRLQEQGVPVQACPDSRQLECIRRLSGRRTAVEMLPRIRLPQTVGQSVLVHSVEDIPFEPPFLLKAPWSGSGRGIQKVEGALDAPMQGWVNHILKTQGGIVAEPYYNKVVDFAMEFRMVKGEVLFVGYSLFETDMRGLYKENLLATDDEIECRLAVCVPVEVLQHVRERLLEELPLVLEGYEGYFGVDMMICRVGNGYAVHPCVEINLRMNMGVVTRLLYDRHVVPGATGRYVVEYYPSPGEALRMHHALQQQYPLEMEGQKIRQGYLSLTPVFDDTVYQVFVLVTSD